MRDTNRQELMAAIDRRVAGRVPYTYEARSETDAMLKEYLGLATDDSVAEYFDCNQFSNFWAAIGGGPSLPERQERLKSGDPNVRIDIWGVTREPQQAGSATYWEVSHYPLAAAETVADIEAYDWPRPEEVVWPELPADFDIAAWKANRVVLNMSYLGPFGIPWYMRGLDRLMMDTFLNPELVDAMIAKVEEYTIPCLRTLLEKYPGVVDLVGSGDDYGTQNGLLMSTDTIGRFFMPSLKKHYDLAAEYGVKGYHHCCGAIFDMIPLFIDAGLDLLNPIQTSARGMAPVRLKEAYGQDLAFHGAMDIQQTLVTGSPDDVRAEVRKRIDELGPEGYILGPSHVLQPDTPPENIVAMYEEAAEYGCQ